MKQRDLETRERLLKAAAQLFADRGFKRVTVRDICRVARANVAAVNYHFGDKTGLYREVLQLAIETIRSTNDAARAAGEGLPPDERLRQYIKVSLCRVMSTSNLSWISRIVHRELSDPTPAVDALVDQPPLTMGGTTTLVFSDQTADLRPATAAAEVYILSVSPDYFRAAGASVSTIWSSWLPTFSSARSTIPAWRSVWRASTRNGFSLFPTRSRPASARSSSCVPTMRCRWRNTSPRFRSPEFGRSHLRQPQN